MNLDTAKRINAAASHAWMWNQGILERIPREELELLLKLSVGQIDTAIDVVRAENRNAKPINGMRTITSTLHPDYIEQVQNIARAALSS